MPARSAQSQDEWASFRERQSGARRDRLQDVPSFHHGHETDRSAPDAPDVLVTRPGYGSGVMTRRQVVALQRTIGNRALTRVLDRGHRSGDGIGVQRWAFINEVQVAPKEKSLNARMKALAADKLVHNYTSSKEFKDHAAGKTDHLGNLPGPASTGTWARFNETGTNLLGENHTEVTLEHVVRAVRSTSFIYEPFSVDAMPKGSKMRAAYEVENKKRFKDFGVAKVKDKQQFGAESLFPKMGFGLNLLIPYLTGAGRLGDLTAGAYVGQPVQRYLKIA